MFKAWHKFILPTVFGNLLAIIMPINFLLDSNYMYVNAPPQVDNPLVIGDWPYYILLWEIFILIIAYMVYSISRRKLVL